MVCARHAREKVAGTSTSLVNHILPDAGLSDASSLLAWAVVLAVALAAGAARIAYLRQLRRDRDRLCAAIDRVGEGDYKQFATDVGNGELREIADACDRLIPRLQNTIAQLEWSARHDPMTDLYNSTSFKLACQSLLAAQTGSNRGALLVLGINQLKKVNDSLGHAGGDQLLCAVADRLRLVSSSYKEGRLEALTRDEVIDHGDALIGRLGGDEFAIFLPGVADKGEIERFIQRLQRVIGEAIHISQQSLRVKLSIGVAFANGRDHAYDQLLAAADSAMTKSKGEGAGSYLFYSPEMRRAADELLEREMDLRNALQNGEFCLFYQPQLNLHSGRIESVEALIRWQHPTRGLVYPGDFIPFAETYGLIDDIGDWVILEAVRTAARWHAEGRGLRVSINVSPMQLHRVELIPMIRACMARFALPPQLLEIEITEAALMRHEEFCLERIEGLRRDGVSVALDDFGTGYSNLAQLMSLPMDRLKLDRSLIETLVSDRRKQVVASSIIGMVRELGFEVVAEGVETAEQFELLRASDCDYIQGYMISRPIPEATLFALIDAIGSSSGLGESPDSQVA